MRNFKYKETLFYIVLFAAALLPRVIGLAKFVTLDEPYWLVSGSNFYYALAQRDFAHTVWDYHPAVTTMWMITFILLLYFPAYRGQGQGYFYLYKEWKYEEFLREHGKYAVDVLQYTRLLQVFLLLALALLLYWLMLKILDKRASLFALMLILFNPMILGHSRLLTHEVTLSVLTFISITSMTAYLYREKRFGYLVVSAVSASLAQLTKSSSIVLFPVILLMFIVNAWDERKSAGLIALMIDRLKSLAIWSVIIVVVYFAVWPVMWVNPSIILREVYGNAFSYFFKGARLYTTQNLDNINFNFKWSGIGFFIETMLWRTTPITWLGTLAAFFFFFKKDFLSRAQKQYAISITLSGILMLLMFGLAKGRNSPHYVMLTYAALDFWAALGLLGLVNWFTKRWADSKPWLNPAALTALIAIQAGMTLNFYPYYYTYFNPIMEARQTGTQNGNFGYGEGLDLAAQYLAQKNDAQSLTVLAYWGDGPFSYIFPGRSILLPNNYYLPEMKDLLAKDLRRSDYLVIYYAYQKSMGRIMNLVNALEPYPPEKIIWMNGVEYIRIYDLRTLPKEFFDGIKNQ